MLPIRYENLSKNGKGNNIEINGKEPLRSFGNANKEAFFYRGYFDKEFGSPFLFINNKQGIIGSYCKLAKGNILFIPSINDNTYNEEEKITSLIL